MGKLIGGGSKQSSHSASISHSFNQAYPLLTKRLLPGVSSAVQGSAALNAFLKGNTSGFDRFSNNAGYDFAKERGEGNIMTMLGASGLRNSGAAMKRLTEFNTDLRQQYIDKYLAALAQQTGLGLQAANTIGGVGGRSDSYSNSTGTSSSTGGIGSTLGSLAQAAAMA